MTVVIVTVVTVTVVIFVTLVIVTVATVAVGTVVIVTYFSKNNLTPRQQMRYSQGSFSRFSRCFKSKMTSPFDWNEAARLTNLTKFWSD